MVSTRKSLAKARSAERRNFTHVKGSRGMSARAYTTKTMTWELTSAKGVIANDASVGKETLTQVMEGIQENYPLNEKQKKVLE